MSLKERLMEDLKVAMKEKDVLKKNAITMIRAAVKQVEVDKRIELGDEEILDIISKQLKEKKMAILEFEKGNRQDLIDLTNNEMEILLEYLPKQLSQEEVEGIVKEAIEAGGYTSAKEIGKIMKDVMPKVKGKADGNMVNQAVKKIFE